MTKSKDLIEMLCSTLTKKGQTTIPKEVREFLGLSPEDKIIYALDQSHNQVVLTPITGTILGLKGSVSHRTGIIDFKKLRRKTKKFVLSKRK